MRTGDYGTYFGGELYVTGRVKDLVIVDGRNHYPQDLEYTAQEASRALRPGYVAAFSVPANQLPSQVFNNPHSGLNRDPQDSSEQLVVVGERAPGAHKSDIQSIADDIRAAVAVAPRGHRARRAAGAGRFDPTHLQRQGRPPACRAAYIDGSLRGGVASPNSFPDLVD